MSSGGFSLRRLLLVDEPAETPTRSTAEIDALLADALRPAESGVPAPSVAATSAITSEEGLIVVEGVELPQIYANAGVRPAHFTIEKLAKIAEGLNQLDSVTKRTAVAAMDAADDTWDIAAVIADGKAKCAALETYRSEVTQRETAINAEISRRIEASQAEKNQRLADIDAQIAELQAQREKAISDTATATASLRAQGVAAAEAAERERNRISTVVRGFSGLMNLFDTSSIPSA